MTEEIPGGVSVAIGGMKQSCLKAKTGDKNDASDKIRWSRGTWWPGVTVDTTAYKKEALCRWWTAYASINYARVQQVPASYLMPSTSLQDTITIRFLYTETVRNNIWLCKFDGKVSGDRWTCWSVHKKRRVVVTVRTRIRLQRCVTSVHTRLSRKMCSKLSTATSVLTWAKD